MSYRAAVVLLFLVWKSATSNCRAKVTLLLPCCLRLSVKELLSQRVTIARKSTLTHQFKFLTTVMTLVLSRQPVQQVPSYDNSATV
ncbi:hypothetical protein K1T71_000409 [Dendrolimus kikuchii]|uniref:Uncharacterized protein n=1 Tax=Dendrolimus kikuchii TaxID=765133 RepID=A0ACC1DJA2_9NEOP|nr:hypothetical protein K1T71_000409 [Dendrolimus kikuchii]